MIRIKNNFSLKSSNTLGIDVKARYFVRTENLEDLSDVLKNRKDCFPFLILGGGSNILFTRDYNGIVIQPALKGIKIIDNDPGTCLVEVGAGEEWDDYVNWAVENSLGGIENLSLIPGTTGSSPIQNIGAYGVEVKDVIEKVNYLDLESFNMVSLSNHECQFGYRNSIFKNQLKNRVVITSVVFRLHHVPVFNTSYGNLQEEIGRKGKITLETVRNAVIAIRQSKLPDPKVIGNAGSFFKNPVVELAKANQLKEEYNSMPIFPVSDQWIKIPAGWLIEQCGWKGKRLGNAGVHDKQALVIVNYGKATGTEIRDLAMKISESVFSKFNIMLEPEVNII
jgi:UDP-N-acetylmuramate dehydrogenase